MFTSFIHSLVNAFMAHPLIIFILAINFGVIGLVYSFLYWSKLNADGMSKNWPSVPGKITTSRTEERIYNSHTSGMHLTRSVSYEPVVKYSYEVAGTLYHAKRIGNSIYSGTTPNAVERWVKLFPANTTVPVYYNPADPNDAVLIPKTNNNIFEFIGGMAIGVLGLFFLGLWIYSLVTRH
jgi:hypothetical protein